MEALEEGPPGPAVVAATRRAASRAHELGPLVEGDEDLDFATLEPRGDVSDDQGASMPRSFA